MKKINNKGFSLIELLAVMVILGILMTTAIAAYSTYRKQARQKAYDTMAKSATEATKEYLMTYPGTKKVNFDELTLGEYLSDTADPRNKTKICTGTVYVTPNAATTNTLATNDFKVSMCCEKYNYTYTFPGGQKVEDKSGCAADENVANFIETTEANCSSGKTKTVSKGIYTMNYLGKTCSMNASGTYEGCSDSQGNLPCRQYDYHQRTCTCVYSKTSNKFCSSSVSASGDNHIMKIRYLNNDDGIYACNSSQSKYINSYVDHVCTYGTFGSGVNKIDFHGYSFYRGLSTSYADFNPDGSWFHDGGDYERRATRKPDIAGKPDYENGCRDTCIKLTEQWSGKVK